MQITNRRLRKSYTALSIISGRNLPSRDTEKKCAVLRRLYLSAHFEVTEDRIRKIRENHRVPEDLDSTQLPVAILEARQRDIEAMNDELIEIKDIPKHLLFDDDDFPRSFKKSEDNAQGVGDLMDSLDFLYPIVDKLATVDERPADDRT